MATVLSSRATGAAPAWATGDDPAVLAGIARPGRALAIWRRALDPALGAALAALAHEAIDDLAAPLPLADAALHAAALLGQAGYPAEVAVPLARDIAGLAALHPAAQGGDRVALRLEWIETDSCRRFHADAVGVRLLATYLGRGTQWRPAAVDDDALRELAAGEVALFKGRLLDPDAPILHRSPPIAGSGERRLLLVIDAEGDAAAHRVGGGGR